VAESIALGAIRDAPVTRFAPSPTGHLHLGHLVNAIFVWGIARLKHGVVILRLEDHDRGRSRAEFESSILEDLEWLGFEPDRPTTEDRRRGASGFRQSDAPGPYRQFADQLAGETYWCDCSRKEISGVGPPRPDSAELRYPGTCRDRGLGAAGDRGLRLRMDDREETFQDLRLGAQRQTPARQCGDLLIRDRHGNWTYQFACTVDDVRQDVDLVIRGEDLLPSTGRQIALARRLRRGRERLPAFVHHPLILDPTGRKLSKRDSSTGIRELRQAGARPEDVIGKAAQGVGLVSAHRPLSANDVPELFV
jgi:glutamyl/glutaminyl-tRNA synthetase